MRKAKVGDLVMVYWQDPAGKGGWSEPETVSQLKLAECQSVAWLLSTSEEDIRICSSKSTGCDGTPYVGDVTVIATSLVTRIEVLTA